MPAETIDSQLPGVQPTVTPLLAVRSLSKSFAAPVLKEIDLTIGMGEVHALLGANGAGKSTLANIISGLHDADSGSISMFGAEVIFANKAEAEKAGVQMVMQELNLLPTLTVAENLFFGRFPGRLSVIDYPELHRKARGILEEVGLEDVNPEEELGNLGVGQQQLVEIASAISRDCRLLVLDEPTASLTDPQIDLLFDRINRLKATGTGVLYISHRMEEIRRIADRVTVLRDGVVSWSGPAADVSVDGIVTHMVGEQVETVTAREQEARGKPALVVNNLASGDRVRDVHFDVNYGEILGLSGLVGCGRTETLRAVFGADAKSAGDVFLPPDHKPRSFSSPARAVKAGVGMIPEDRKELGLLLSQSLKTNMTLGSLYRFSGKAGWIRQKEEEACAEQYRVDLAVQCDTIEQKANELSGGNQQKVVLARWLLRDCPILLFDEPTKGIDVAARAKIHSMLLDLAADGKAIVVVSSDSQELMAICDRITVLSAGVSVATFVRGEWSSELLLEAAFSEYAGGRAVG